MIIKKKYTNIKKILEEPEVIDTSDVDLSDFVQQKVETVIEKEEVIVEEKIEEPPKKSNDDFNLSLDNIKFEQREERREGTRRRGYRRTQDRKIVSRAQEEAVSIKEAAKQEGYQEGINNAVKDIELLKEKFAEFYNYKEEVYEKVSECIMDIAVEIAKKIINKEVQTDRETTLSIIKGAVEEINKTENKITLKVMPKDVEIVRDKIPEIFEGNYFEAKVSVIPDATIKEGGVIIETSNGLIDASIETQVAIIEKALNINKEDN